MLVWAVGFAVLHIVYFFLSRSSGLDVVTAWPSMALFCNKTPCISIVFYYYNNNRIKGGEAGPSSNPFFCQSKIHRLILSGNFFFSSPEANVFDL